MVGTENKNENKKTGQGKKLGIGCLGLTALLFGWGAVSYSRDAQPTLEITSPQSGVTVQTSTVEIKGRFEPKDRKVWVNGKKIKTGYGEFSTIVDIAEGKNEFEIKAGDWKRAEVRLTVIRELTPEERAAKEAEEKAREEERRKEEEEKRLAKEAEEKVQEEARRKEEEERQRKGEEGRLAREEEERRKAEAEKPFGEKEEITEDAVRAEIRDLPSIALDEDELNRVEIVEHLGTDDPNDQIVNLRYQDESFWDEKVLMKTAATTAVEAMSRLFKNPRVGLVRVWVETEFTDQYGKKSMETAVRVGLERTTADKIEWENFKDWVLVDYNRLLDIADEKYIHPAVRKEL